MLHQSQEDKMLIQNKIKSVDLRAKLCNHPLTYFNYSSTTFDYYIYESIHLEPNYDSSNCLFEIEPSILLCYVMYYCYLIIDLPKGITINQKDGVIRGFSRVYCPKQIYTVICRNLCDMNVISFYFVLNILPPSNKYHFTSESKDKNMDLNNNDMKVIHRNEKSDAQCYMNLEMKSGIYRIRVLFKSNSPIEKSDFIFGATRCFCKSGLDLYNDVTTCCFSIHGKGFTLYGGNGIKNENVEGRMIENKEVYEFIFNMNIGEFSVKFHDDEEILLFQNISSPLKPFAMLWNINQSLEITSVRIE